MHLKKLNNKIGWKKCLSFVFLLVLVCKHYFLLSIAIKILFFPHFSLPFLALPYLVCSLAFFLLLFLQSHHCRCISQVLFRSLTRYCGSWLVCSIPTQLFWWVKSPESSPKSSTTTGVSYSAKWQQRFRFGFPNEPSDTSYVLYSAPMNWCHEQFNKPASTLMWVWPYIIEVKCDLVSVSLWAPNLKDERTFFPALAELFLSENKASLRPSREREQEKKKKRKTRRERAKKKKKRKVLKKKEK